MVFETIKHKTCFRFIYTCKKSKSLIITKSKDYLNHCILISLSQHQHFSEFRVDNSDSHPFIKCDTHKNYTICKAYCSKCVRLFMLQQAICSGELRGSIIPENCNPFVDFQCEAENSPCIREHPGDPNFLGLVQGPGNFTSKFYPTGFKTTLERTYVLTHFVLLN